MTTSIRTPVIKVSRLRPFALHVVLPLATGSIIYLLWRSPDLAVFDWARAIGLTHALERIRSLVSPLAPSIPAPALYSLPDGLWAYSLTACLALVWRDRPGWMRTLWLGACVVLTLGSELGQLLQLVPGRFDVADVLFYGAGILTPLALGLHKQQEMGETWTRGTAFR
jgi:hypothetical protein